MIEVSVVIPTLNEEKTIGICIDKINKIFDKYQINGEIIVSDSSTDSTPDIAKSKGARVIHLKEKGYGNAYIGGINASKGKYIVIGDADNTYDFLEIPKFLDPLRNKEADFVIGNRFGGGIEKGAMPSLHRYIGNPLLTKILNLFFHGKISDAHCGMRGFTRDAWKKLDLKTGGMEFASEMIIKAIQKKLEIKEIPIKLYPREGGPAKINSFTDGWRHLRFMMLLAPNYLFMIPGLLLFGVGLMLMTLLLFGPLKIGMIKLDIHPMVLGSLLTLFGFQIILYSFIVKEYGVTEGLIPESRTIHFYHSHFNLESGLKIGMVITILGFLFNLWILLAWISKGMGAMHVSSLRVAILALTIFIIGIEIMFTSFVMSIFNIKHIYSTRRS
ncbi:MAG TPA: glycosyltransferase family 2 protein [Methanofastidiosum sp.]|mgnify:CR=1 FL=1|jgi:glycosyltransferase involved in cell wall biosynthesis|nr:glycosyltransferase family 2 protein [Methanofastidiosum sp.]